MQEILEVILNGMHRKYRSLLEIERQTLELADLLASDDRDSVQIVLKMRLEEMEKVQEADAALRELLQALDSELYGHVSGLMNGKQAEISGQYPEEEKIVRLAQQSENILNKIITVDKRLSLKVAGKDSYYK